MTLTSLLYGQKTGQKFTSMGKSKILYDTSMGIVKILYDLDFSPLWAETQNLYLVRIGSVLK